MTNLALDTNILIYSHDQDDLYKQDIARELILNPLLCRHRLYRNT
jgi:predicted nucleic acid-binding protein